MATKQFKQIDFIDDLILEIKEKDFLEFIKRYHRYIYEFIHERQQESDPHCPVQFAFTTKYFYKKEFFDKLTQDEKIAHLSTLDNYIQDSFPIYFQDEAPVSMIEFYNTIIETNS